MKLKLFHKFALLFILISIIPLIFVGLNTVNINRESLRTSILQLHTHIAKAVSENISSYILNVVEQTHFVENMLSLPSGDPAYAWEIKKMALQTFLDSNPNIAFVSIVDKFGREHIRILNPSLEKKERLSDFASHPSFLRLKSEPKNYTLSEIYFYDNKFDEPRLDIFRKIRIDKPSSEIYLVISLSLKSLWQDINSIIKKEEIGPGGVVYLVNKEGKIIFHPDEKKILKDVSHLSIVKQVLVSMTEGSHEFVYDEPLVGAYSPINMIKCGVIVTQPKKYAYYPSMLIQRQAFYIIIITLLIAGAIAIFFARSLSKPILAIAHASQRVANQDFNVKIDIKTHDELSYLARTFNDMTLQLKRYADIQLDKLIAEKTKTEAILFSIDDGIVMTDKNGEILLANSKAKKILGIENIEEGKSIFSYANSEHLKSAFTMLTSEIEKPLKEEVDLSGKEYTRVYQFITQPVKTLKGEYLGNVLVMRDISLEKEIDKLKDDFLHSITHDLRNPMTSIRGFVKFLLQGVAGPLNAQQQKMLETVDRASTRLLNLINDILDVAKLEAGKMELNLSETDLQEVCRDVIEVLSPQAERKSIKMVLDISDKIPKIMVDKNLIERVYFNLIGNAIKFTPENGNITIKIRENRDMIESMVIDTGEGIPPEYLDKIFDKYQQVAGHRKGGTGLGLTICKYIIEAHKGKIWAESKLGEGSKFIFLLPKNT